MEYETVGSVGYAGDDVGQDVSSGGFENSSFDEQGFEDTHSEESEFHEEAVFTSGPDQSDHELSEGEEISFERPGTIIDFQEYKDSKDKEMDPEKGLSIAKNEGFESALVYFAEFGEDTKEQDEQVEVGTQGSSHTDETVDQGKSQKEQALPGDPRAEADIEFNEESAQNTEDMAVQEKTDQSELMESPQVKPVLEALKHSDELMKKILERLEEKEELDAETLLIMALLMKKRLEKKKDKDEEEAGLLASIFALIGFLAGMIVDPDAEAEKVQKKVEKAAA